jgi:hypothetical protein
MTLGLVVPRLLYVDLIIKLSEGNRSGRTGRPLTAWVRLQAGTISLSFSGDLLRSIGIGGFVETGPALLNITLAACPDIYRAPPVKDSLGLGDTSFLHSRGDNRSSAADAFRV